MALFRKKELVVRQAAWRLNLLQASAWVAVFTLFSSTLAAQSAANTATWNGSAGDEDWNNTANWTYGSSQSSSLAPHRQTSSLRRNAIFLDSAEIKLTENVSTAPASPATNNMGVVNFSNGSIVFDLSGFHFRASNFIFGDGVGNTASVSFRDSTNSGNSLVTIGNLVLGANGSSGNTFDSSIVFDGVNFSGPTGSVVIGSANGGVNNLFKVNEGETFSLGSGITLNSGTTSGRSQNRVDVDGGTLNLSANNFNIQGNGSVTATIDGETYDNQFLVRNGGKINFDTGTSTRTITVGSGSELRLIEESEFTVSGTRDTAFNLEEKGLLLVDNSSFSSLDSDNFTISGIAVVKNQGVVNQVGDGSLTINSGGSLSLDEGSYILESSVGSNYNTLTGTVGGLLNVDNGSLFQGTFTTTELPGDQGLRSLFVVNSTGHIVVDNNSTFSINNILRLEQGSQFEVKGNSTAEIGRYETYYQAGGGSYFSAETPTVEEGSTFRFETLVLRNRQLGGDNINVLNADGKAQGLLIWGTGGAAVTQFNGHTEAHLNLAAGTRLRLDGTSAMEYSLNNGRFTISSGASLEGSGVLSESTLTINEGIINPGINNGAQGEAGQLTFKYDGSDIFYLSGNIHMDVYGLEEYDQVLLPDYNDVALTVNLWDRGDSGLDFLFADTEFELFRNLSGGDVGSTANVSFDFSQSALVLADLGLAWNSSEFESRGVLTVQEVARLVYTNEVDDAQAPGSTLGDGDVLKVANALHAIRSEGELIDVGLGVDAKIVSKEVSNAGFEVDGLEAETVLANPNNTEGENSASGEVSFINNNALNGTHTATLALGVDLDANTTSNDLHDQVTQTWTLSHTVSGRVADSGIAYIDAGTSYANFSLMSTRGTEAKIFAGSASNATILQMNLDGSGPSLPQGALSDVLTLEGTGTDEYVLSMTYDLELYGEIGGGESPMLAWYDTNLNDWVNAVLGNVGDSTPTYYEGAWSASYGLGSYGWDEVTNSVWAVLDHNSQFAVITNIVPEPGRVLLLLVGAATLLLRRRRSVIV